MRTFVVVAVALAVGLGGWVGAQGAGSGESDSPESAWTPPPCVEPSIFTDVPCSSQFAAWVQALFGDAITSGCGATTYCPNGYVTRRQMAVFLERAMRGTAAWTPVVSPHAHWGETWTGTGTGLALTGGTLGVSGSGSTAGGYFADSEGTATASVGSGTFGVWALGDDGGGHFADTDGSAATDVGAGGYGIYALGTGAGGFFKDDDQSGYAHVGVDDYGIMGYGNYAGGFFGDADGGSGWANVGTGEYGIWSLGNAAGGHFEDPDTSASADVGASGYGIFAQGTITGGYFSHKGGTSWASVAMPTRGIEAQGSSAGGYFWSPHPIAPDHPSWAFLGTEDACGPWGCEWGIACGSSNGGGKFQDSYSGAIGFVGAGTWKVGGTGSAGFIQNHPVEKDKVIVYTCPEGDEVATYTRGTARLVGGEARVPLGQTFQWVTNPDIGLTAHLTPRGEAVPLAVVSISTEELVVRGPVDGPDGVVFDYLVYGLRIGFEATTVVEEKQGEMYIPSMNGHRERLAKRPELARFTALARYSAERETLGVKEPLVLDRAAALVAAIHEFDPAVDKIPDTRPKSLSERPSPPVEQRPGAVSFGTAATAGAVPRVQAVRSEAVNPAPVIDERTDVRARSFSSPRGELATRVAVSGEVEAGDVLVVDAEVPERMTRGSQAGDPTVVGVAVGEAGVALGVARGEGADTASVATSGIVRCKVDAGFGAVVPGDLLVTSPTPAHAMRAFAPAPGTVVGKALEPIASGTGTIRVLVMLR